MSSTSGNLIPSNFRKLYDKSEIQKQVERVAQEIDAWIDAGNVGAQEDGDGKKRNAERDVLALPVLRGGLYFYADLSRAIRNSLDCNPIQSWAYQGVENTALPTGVSVNLSDFPVKGRRVLIVDDICDSGKTFDAIQQRLLDRGAVEVVAAALIQRVGIELKFTPRWVGFTYDGPEWFVGYGMDDGGRWRNLPEIYLID
ncbi:MAG: hypothetical protein KDD60_09720 [Bdellovibrionales bacterium]|nr:hypothetical protein [Bdellovibrionales bacterium]